MAADSQSTNIPEHIQTYLDAQPTLTLATATRGGIPRAATLTYVTDGLSIYVWTRPDTTTARQMQENPVVFFAIGEYTEDWREAKGIQAAAEAQVVLNPNELSHVVELFEQKYPALAGALGSAVSLFRLTPTELDFIDNRDAPPVSAGGGIPYARDSVFSIFRDLPREQLETVEAQLRTVEVAGGEVIVRQGTPADKFFIIVDGEVEVIHEEHGETRLLATLKSGQFFGEMAILRDTPRMATVRAVSPTTLFTMERDTFRGLVAQSMGTTRDFDQIVQQRMDEIRGAHAS